MFAEQGTGKTKMIIDIACYKHELGNIEKVVVLSIPKGVHRQWGEFSEDPEMHCQLQKHVWPGLAYSSFVWNGREFAKDHGRDGLEFYSGNIDLLKSKAGMAAVLALVKTNPGKVMFVLDESQSIKNPDAMRTKLATRLAASCGYRAIMTGTPIAKNLLDEWSQFMFLDWQIIGLKYKTHFLREYCVMGGYEGREVIGTRNLEKFNRLIAPYTFRVTKEPLGLPPKLYDKVTFDLSDEQRKHMKNLADFYATQLESGKIVTAVHAASAALRLHQVSCGHSVSEDGTVERINPNPRLAALEQLILPDRKYVIWCRFREDVFLILDKFKSAVPYMGEMKDKELLESKTQFIKGNAQLFVATLAKGSTGLDGLQHACNHVVYYSNSYAAIDRWQSEDRTHRHGTKGTVYYIDLIARASPDLAIMRNLKGKKELSDNALDMLQQIIRDVR
jgi:SNF2 family DNA or RNA helicase